MVEVGEREPDVASGDARRRRIRSDLVGSGPAVGLERSEAQGLADLLQYATDMITVTDIGGTCTFASGATSSLMGMRPEDVVGLTSEDLIHPDDLPRVTDTAARQLFGELNPAPILYRQLHADGGYRHIEAHVSALPPGHPLGVVVINSRDVSERVEAERARAESQAVIAMVAEGRALAPILDAVIGLVQRRAPNSSLRIESGRPGDDDHRLIEPRRRVAVETATRSAPAVNGSRTGRCLLGGGPPDAPDPGRIERTITGADGSALGALTLVCPSASPGGLLTALLDEVQDLLSIVLERGRAEAALAHRATHDPLTGLPNRALLQDRMDQALNRLRRNRGQPVTALFVDLDGFKSINDSRGHDVGDEVLREAASRLTSTIRQVDTVARLGGDEFVILAVTNDPEPLARRLNAAMRAPYASSGGVPLSCSIGIAVATESDTSASLLARADAAMYQVKARGRDDYLVAPSAAP